MLLAIVAALLPVVATLSLGYFAAWHRDFGTAEATVLNRMVIDYALPLSLFAGTMAIRRRDLMADVPTALAIAGSMLATYIFIVLMAHFVWRRDLGSSALQALAIAMPAIPFVGATVLNALVGADRAMSGRLSSRSSWFFAAWNSRCLSVSPCCS